MLKENIQNKTIYLKTFTLRNKDIAEIKSDIQKHMILIIRITPLAQKDVDELRIVIEDLYKSVTNVGGDISRLGEERIIITPPNVKIWHRQKDVDMVR